jgi:ABC-2 type transport system permease protein
MKKALLIGFKDLALAFRDRAALILMLAAPFALTLALGFISGRFSGRDTTGGLADIPVVVVNQDAGPLGGLLADVLNSADLAELLEPATAADAANARALVDDDQVAAAVLIPAGFSASIIPAGPQGQTAAPVAIEVYANPARPLGANVIAAIVETFVSRVETARVAGAVTIGQLVASGRLAAAEALGAAQALAAEPAGAEGESLITVERAVEGGATSTFDVIAFFAPGMAMLFLMYTVSQGGRSLLAERDQGTLARLMATPTAAAQILGGKVLGIFLTGAAQVGVLVVASSVLFGLRWGDPLAVAVLILAVALAATGWGLLLAAFARTTSQVGSLGAALMLLFGILSGTFVDVGAVGALSLAAKLTPNAWGLQGFEALARGGTLADVALPIAALLGMGAVLFTLAVGRMGRKFVVAGA